MTLNRLKFKKEQIEKALCISAQTNEVWQVEDYLGIGYTPFIRGGRVCQWLNYSGKSPGWVFGEIYGARSSSTTYRSTYGVLSTM